MNPRRQTILEACERLLCGKGPAKTTMAEIAKEAGLAVGSLYLDFDSKEAIVAELSRSTHAKILEAMRVAAAATPDHAERITAVFEARTRAFLRAARAGAHGADLVHCQSDGVRVAHDEHVAAERALIEQLLEGGIRAGALAAREPSTCAEALVAAYARLSPPTVFRIRESEVDRLLPALHALVLDGLRRRS
jgi:AcrR family transcriptional regulator